MHRGSASSAPKPPHDNPALAEFLDGFSEMIADFIIEDQAKEEGRFHADGGNLRTIQQ